MKIPKCEFCGVEFEKKYSSLQKTCSVPCSIEIGKKNALKKIKAEQLVKKRIEAEELKQKKEDIKTVSDLLKDFEKVFNEFIRIRDFGKDCISCGAKYGTYVVNAGHYFTAGNHKATRFHEDNVHNQCVFCNKHLHGNTPRYLPNLIFKIGKERFDELEKLSYEGKNWTRCEIKEQIELYKCKIKALKNPIF